MVISSIVILVTIGPSDVSNKFFYSLAAIFFLVLGIYFIINDLKEGNKKRGRWDPFFGF